MSLIISNDCINCCLCENTCPNNAIFQGEEFFVINPELCNECIGFFNHPQCQQVCPITCITQRTP